jgi:hypothetical protein
VVVYCAGVFLRAGHGQSDDAQSTRRNLLSQMLERSLPSFTAKKKLILHINGLLGIKPLAGENVQRANLRYRLHTESWGQTNSSSAAALNRGSATTLQHPLNHR